ncbi:MAG TPA: hypothetical protein VGR66_01870 [Candidatus Eisenbacteria bacterium]|nr:hypothetical protein [Candidatus Eisenbacteria bacterium]
MRWRAVLVPTLSLVVFCTAHAEGTADSSNVRIAIQGGVVSGFGLDDRGPVGMIDLSWIPWPEGGLWWEVGVLEQPISEDLLVSPATLNTRSSEDGSIQHLEASAGFLLQGSDETAVTPYLRAGLGAYRIEPDIMFARIYQFEPPTAKWSLGGSVAAGARIGSPKMHVGPVLEGRCHFTRPPGGESRVLLTLTGGLWFR